MVVFLMLFICNVNICSVSELIRYEGDVMIGLEVCNEDKYYLELYFDDTVSFYCTKDIEI